MADALDTTPADLCDEIYRQSWDAALASKYQDRQETFDASVLLLLGVFPSRGDGAIDEKNWDVAERFLPQVLAVLKNFRDSQKEPEPLVSSKNLVELVCDTLWYIRQTDTGENRDAVITTAFIAWEKWDDPEKDPLLYANILTRSSDQDTWIGEPQSAIRKGQECLTISSQNLPTDDQRVLVANNNLALAYATSGDYERGANYFSRAEDIFNSDPDRYGIATCILINANTARNSYCKGDFRDAENRLVLALAKAKEFGSAYWQAVINLASASLYLRMAKVAEAESAIQQASTAIDVFAPTRNLLLNSRYAYFLGRIRLAQGRIAESIEQFEKTVAIDGIQLSPQVYRARNIYALSRALSASTERKNEGKQLANNAMKMIGKITMNLDDDNWDVFDLLIRVSER